MARLADPSQYRELARLRAVMTQAAAAEVAEALVRERRAEEDVVACDERVRDAGRRWHSHLVSGLQPELGGAYARRVVERETEVAIAEEVLTDARGARTASEDGWREARAAQRSIERVAKIAERRRSNRREEAALATAADCALRRWRQS